MNLRKLKGIYHVSVAGKGGKRKLISTGCSDRSKAVKVASESGVADLEMAAKASRLTREVIGHITTGRRLTMAKALQPFEDWLTTCARSPKTVANNLTTIKRWLADMGIEGLAPGAVCASHIARWVNNPQSDSKRSTRAVGLSCIRSLFNFMAANGWIVADVSKLVAVDASVMSHQQKESVARVPFTDTEVAKLLEWTENNSEWFWYFAVLVSSETGLRLGDICQMEWGNFKNGGTRFSVWTDKTGSKVEHLVSPALAESIGCIPVTDAIHLFPEQRTLVLDVKKRGLLSVQFKRICDGLGIKGKSFHCLRHRNKPVEDINSMAQSLAEKLSMEEMRKLLGHSSANMTKKYVH
jgi:integrase